MLKRFFLPWTQACLPAAAHHLVEEFGTPTEVDLHDVCVVVPGRRAGRRLLTHLVAAATASGRALHPPLITPPHGLRERLVERTHPVASPLERRTAWALALGDATPDELSPLLPDPQPFRDGGMPWILARELEELHAELDQHGMDFDGVAHQGELALGAGSELARWKTLAGLERAMRRHLYRAGRIDPLDRFRTALEEGLEDLPRAVVLVAVPELTGSVRTLLDRIRDRVQVLVHAPETLSAGFDAWGATLADFWTAHDVGIDPAQVRVVDGPGDQAFAALQLLGEPARASLPDITLGLVDPDVEAPLQHALTARGLRGHLAGGRTLNRSRPLRLLEAIGDFLRQRTWDRLAALVRHPDVETLLRERASLPADLLVRLDREYATSLPHRLPPPRRARELRGEWPARVLGAVDDWLAPLHRARQPVDHWVDVVMQLVEAASEPHDDPEAIATLTQLMDRAVEVVDLPAELAARLRCRAADGIDLLLQHLREATIPDPPTPAGVEILGWLELALDDAPHCIVVGVNEGHLPRGLRGHAFLPDRVRGWLGLTTHLDRQARDTYLMASLAASKQSFRVVAGRVRDNGDPMVPSRLLLGRAPLEMARRVERFFGPRQARSVDPLVVCGLTPGQDADSFLAPPRPEAFGEVPVLDRVGVTSLRDYVACPYRFYLSRVLRLRPRQDQDQELDALGFGTLTHTVLEQFGRTEVANRPDPRAIRSALEELLAAEVARRFGNSARAAVRVQVEQLRRRLATFARWQAQRVRDGWRIQDVEVTFDHETLKVGDHPVVLRGRIDRVDVHEASGRLAILDYKSSEKNRTPQATHRTRDGAWIDFQLPLYQHLIRTRRAAAGAPLDAARVELGFVTLSRETASVHHDVAAWDPAEVESGIEAARQVIARIRRREFWPPAAVPPIFAGELSPICLDGQFRSALDLQAAEKLTEARA